MADSPRIHILFPFREGPWGGGNHFLAALRDEFLARGRWAETPAEADVVLYDSFNGAGDVVRWKRCLPATPFVHRINGPISVYRGRDRHIDSLIHDLASRVADGVVFQSHYSREANRRLGMGEPLRSTVIMNAPDHSLFHCEGRKPASDGRTRIVITSWSPNWNKGFDIYRHLDESMDFDRFSVTFVGNSPVTFRNIRQLPPRGRTEIADLLRDADIFLSASRNESCSNAVAEAMACGLVPVVHRSGGHAEQIATSGVLFDGLHDVQAAIETAAEGLDGFRAALPRLSLELVADAYVDFCSEVWREAAPPRGLSRTGSLGLQLRLGDAWIRGKVSGLARRLKSVTRPMTARASANS